MFLARATYNQNKASIFERANSLGINVVCLDDIGVHMSRKPELHGCSRTKQNTAQDQEKLVCKVRKLRSPFIKVVDRTENYEPLVLEMKEWPDAFTMFSQGPNVLHEKMERKRQTTFCELCNAYFSDLQQHLSGRRHTKHATNNKIWERVDALRANLPTVEQIIERKVKPLQ